MAALRGFYNTLDIDNPDFHNIARILAKVELCDYSTVIKLIDTQKGFHIKMKCSIDCDKCRLTFDDPKRYAIDLGRPRAKQNVLFDVFSGRKINHA